MTERSLVRTSTIPAGDHPAAASPDDRDVERMVRHEAPDLLAYLVRRTAHPDDAADLLAEVLVVVWRRVAVMPGQEEAARMWLFGIARKVLATHRRGLHRRSALADRLREELQTSVPAAGLDGRSTSAEDSRSERS